MVNQKFPIIFDRLITITLVGLITLGCHKLSVMNFEGTKLKTGDLIFLDLDCGPLCNAIEEVTKRQFRVTSPSLSHVGILVHEPHGWFVYEAWEKVQKTPWSDFIGRLKPGGNWYAARLRLHPKEIEQVVANIRTKMGLPYDNDFEINNSKYYCSELIAENVNQAASSQVLPWIPMYYGDLENRDDPATQTWIHYFNERKLKPPAGKPGISPLGIYLSPVVQTVR